MIKVSIIIPTYNERNNIQKLIPDIEEILKKNNILAEIIIIDDFRNLFLDNSFFFEFETLKRVELKEFKAKNLNLS